MYFLVYVIFFTAVAVSLGARCAGVSVRSGGWQRSAGLYSYTPVKFGCWDIYMCVYILDSLPDLQLEDLVGALVVEGLETVLVGEVPGDEPASDVVCGLSAL